MKRYLIRIVLLAATFEFLFPLIPGVRFHGSFLHAMLAGVLFAFLGWVVETLAIAISAVMTVGTLGLALIVLVPAWFIGFWLLPAVALKWVADFMPSTLSFHGWMPAILGGLAMLLVGVLTSGDTQKKVRRL
jgi:Mycobacterial 4 TMS phage holin, superfamily IV